MLQAKIRKFRCAVLEKNAKNLHLGQKGPFWTVFGQNGQNGKNYQQQKKRLEHFLTQTSPN